MAVHNTWRAKLHAVQTLYSMMSSLRNWAEVWTCYRSAHVVPPLRTRSGLIVHHRPADDAVLLIREVFAGATYRVPLNGSNGDIAIDIGSHIGTVALDWTARHPELNIHAYEPN